MIPLFNFIIDILDRKIDFRLFEHNAFVPFLSSALYYFQKSEQNPSFGLIYPIRHYISMYLWFYQQGEREKYAKSAKNIHIDFILST